MAQHDQIDHEIIYPYRIDQVWEALTDSEQLSAWLMETDFSPVIGHRFTFFDHEPWPDGKIYDIIGEIVACDPPHRLAYTWSSPPKHGVTLVEWELEEVVQGTRVRLRHSGFAEHGDDGRAAYDLLRDGWGGLLNDELAGHLEAMSRAIRSDT